MTTAAVPEHLGPRGRGRRPGRRRAALGALAADPGLRVLLLDRADFPRDKSCGDGIAPHVRRRAAPVGVGDVVDGWAPVRRRCGCRGDAAVERRLARPVWVIPREVFDARLVEHAVARRRRPGAGTGSATCGSTPDGVLVDDRSRAAVVVGADGAHSVVRRPRPAAAAGTRARDPRLRADPGRPRAGGR